MINKTTYTIEVRLAPFLSYTSPFPVTPEMIERDTTFTTAYIGTELCVYDTPEEAETALGKLLEKDAKTPMYPPKRYRIVETIINKGDWQ